MFLEFYLIPLRVRYRYSYKGFGQHFHHCDWENTKI